MVDIDYDEIRKYLKANKVTEEYSDEDLNSLYTSYLNYILNKAGISLTEQTQQVTDINNKNFNIPNYLLPNYPVKEITEVKLDDEILDPEDYYIDKQNGIIRWKQELIGNVLEITYVIEPDEFIIDLINIIVLDMILYNISNNTDEISTVKEGDVSVSYNTNNSTSNRINNNMNDLLDAIDSGKARLIE